MKLFDKKFNSKYGIVQEHDRSKFEHHVDGQRSFEPIDGRLTPVAIIYHPDACTHERFLQETGIDLTAKYCSACDKIEVDFDQQLCGHCAQDKNISNKVEPLMNLSAYLDTHRNADPTDYKMYVARETVKILNEGIRNWRLVRVVREGSYTLEDMTIGEAKTLASFVSQTYSADVTWSDVFDQITKMIRT